MEDQIIHLLRINKIREMKNPTILMNEKDLENSIKEVESKFTNFKAGDNPTFEGVQIITKDFMEKGNIFIYDNNKEL